MKPPARRGHGMAAGPGVTIPASTWIVSLAVSITMWAMLAAGVAVLLGIIR